jgi:predicted TIM-barrel fold metal-dependent hydrolase
MGQFPLQDPANRKLIHGWRNQPGMMGLRWALLLEEQQKWLYDGSLDWLWPAAEKEGLPIAMMGGLFLKKFREIAERHPNLKMIVDHCGLNRPGRDAEAFIHLDELVAMAKLPNVAVKATGAPHYSTEGYPFRNIQDGLHRIYDAFGPKRFFWGTDITRMPCSYRQCVTFFTEELPWLKGRDLEDVMGRGLCAWIGWNHKF